MKPKLEFPERWGDGLKPKMNRVGVVINISLTNLFKKTAPRLESWDFLDYNSNFVSLNHRVKVT